MTTVPAVCMKCQHYSAEKPVSCTAFPDRIPDVVWLEGNPHTEHIPGDHGILFEARDVSHPRLIRAR